jgi:hypothetical protein
MSVGCHVPITLLATTALYARIFREGKLFKFVLFRTAEQFFFLKLQLRFFGMKSLETESSCRCTASGSHTSRSQNGVDDGKSSLYKQFLFSA